MMHTKLAVWFGALLSSGVLVALVVMGRSPTALLQGGALRDRFGFVDRNSDPAMSRMNKIVKSMRLSQENRDMSHTGNDQWSRYKDYQEESAIKKLRYDMERQKRIMSTILQKPTAPVPFTSTGFFK
ncbi:hypothetical protein GUITHDRAFT_153411 [Guillardia theta CCMP2712]|uniref:Uncharacterized protein n=1 Tax=Guillardia theta (strain CCMP2712) TaxID=905079 RepID=L1J4G1_GUITC|nr:hypothetical protein GUITHDRAFT_153411 [Guillardia theta CCMP2712]EKX42975.1 hypothetical protein GUITHDRAFT_153411 [Guillardia theta CCMP2712]|eukprot:XP_005829955.1 hypothetical protein GUITHDRAFT_153411 [Guillardia theta CCMP2712]